MCVQCMAVAATAASGACGIRAWLAAKRPRWITPARLRAASAVLVLVALSVSSIRVG